jgi:hypothetical protein
MTRKLLLVPAFAMTAACAALPEKPVFLTGQWGGPGADLLIEGGLATIRYDCASGSIDSNLSAAGVFSAPGSYRAGQPGPIRVGQIFTSVRATYSGKVDQDVMTLTARLEDGTVIGPHSLTRGQAGQLAGCG